MSSSSVPPSGSLSGSNSVSASVPPSGSNSVSASGSASNSGPPTFALTIPPGVASITQPPQTATSFYKIAQGNLITFGWNMTGVLATPTSLTLSAVCADGNTFPVGPDPSGRVPGTATNVVWDVWSYNQANPATKLAPSLYTLHMWDDRGPSATVQAGYMTPNSALQFAMYTPQGYTPIASGWTCAGCSSALPTRPAVSALLLTLLLVLVSGWGVMRRGRGVRV
ncbi:hypothetical protein C8R45DRAFT_824966 [Mycena sanguinolenta]|nr:hypothetical protein C8R45DRAFT_824966 [Mycena sanguinolenta]